MHFDAIVIGLEPAGCEAAFEASRHGLDVLLVCPDSGESAENAGFVAMHLLREAIVQEQMTSRILSSGASPTPHVRDLPIDRLQRRLHEIGVLRSATLRSRIAQSGIRVVDSGAVLTSPSRVRLSGCEEHEAPIVIVATGSRPRRPTRFEFDDQLVCDYESVFRREGLPRKLLIVGADGIGCEIACAYAALGTSVTALDRRSRLLRFVDRDLLELLHTRMQAAGIEIVLQEELREIQIDRRFREPNAIVRLESGRVEVADGVIVCAGRSPRTEGLGLEALGVETDPRGFICVNDYFQTSVPGLYAVGCEGTSPWLACGSRQGPVAMRHALGQKFDPVLESPLSIYSIPEVSMIGITEEMCRHLDVPCAVGSARLGETLWGQIRSGADGILKLVIERATRRVIGVHAIGPGATDLIQMGTSLMTRGSTVDELAEIAFNPPTTAEVYAIAAQAALRGLPAPETSASFERMERF